MFFIFEITHYAYNIGSDIHMYIQIYTLKPRSKTTMLKSKTLFCRKDTIGSRTFIIIGYRHRIDTIDISKSSPNMKCQLIFHKLFIKQQCIPLFCVCKCPFIQISKLSSSIKIHSYSIQSYLPLIRVIQDRLIEPVHLIASHDHEKSIETKLC